MDANKKKVTKLTFHIIATDLWDEGEVKDFTEEFSTIYGSGLNISRSYLAQTETIDDPDDVSLQPKTH